MVNDEDMGRPPRHERKAKAAVGGFIGNVLTKGEKETVRVEGSAACSGCAKEMSVDFTGPEDSLGVAIARSQLRELVCEDCRGRSEADAERMQRELEMLETIRGRVESCGLPDAWRALTFDRLEEKEPQRQAVETATRWARGDGPVGLVLHGNVGVGKTVIAAAAAVERCARSPVRWISVAALLMDLRLPFGAPEYERAVRLLTPPAKGAAMVLDDLDKMRPTEHQLQPLYVAINGWLEARLPLVVTMNRNLDSLAEWAGPTFGDALGSRLAGYCEVIEVPGKDWRLE